MRGFRAIIAVIVGSALLAGTIRYLGLHHPSGLMSFIFLACGFLAFVSLVVGLRRGDMRIFARSSVSVYQRIQNPFGFWFYVFLFALLGIVFLSVGVYCLFAPHSS
jgi:hypothetical protein